MSFYMEHSPNIRRWDHEASAIDTQYQKTRRDGVKKTTPYLLWEDLQPGGETDGDGTDGWK
jgi:hypothetical protein